MFTTEQIELIRKLRTTGISSDQMLKAFTDMEPENNNKLAAAALYSPLLVQHLTSTPTTSAAVTLPTVTVPPVTVTPVITPTVPPPSNLSIQTVPPPSPIIIPTAAIKSEHSSTSTSPSLFEHPICSSAPRPIRSQRTPMKEITTLDDPTELEEFMQQGEEACILDMKGFITQYSLRQTTVAMMTGVSQPYISKLLNGNHRELSLRCRKNIYCWYLNCRRHPIKLSAFLNDPSTRLETNGDGELIPQRRERYVFRPILIRMLESFFHQTPFPDLPRRVEIADACNHLLRLDKKGVSLMPKEVVSPQVVSNWFANKRKELRRRSAEATTSSASSTSSASVNNDAVSVSSMSPPSRDEEMTSRITTPETPESSTDVITVSPPQPFLIKSENTPSPPTTSLATTPLANITTTSTPSSTISIPSIIPPNPSPLEIFAMARQLGIQLPLFDQTATSPLLPALTGGFMPFPMAGFYNSPVLKTE
ncbi:unnamed protein product [Caenorhabditis brenneri]